MQHCEFCAAELSDESTFCWRCGRAPTHSTEVLTGVSGSPAADLHVWEVATATSIPATPNAIWEAATATNIPATPVPTQTDQVQEDQEESAVTAISTPGNSIVPLPAQGDSASFTSGTQLEEDEEEKRRRAAMIGMGLSLLGDSVPQTPGGNVPMVQGTPQVSGVPMVQGTPHIPKKLHMPDIPRWQIPRLVTRPSIPTIQHASPTQPIALPPQQTHRLQASRRPDPDSNGCVQGLLIAFVAFTFIVAGIIAADLTVVRPVLSLSGSTDVVWGQSIQLHGSNFIPGSSVVLTLDDTEPLYYTSWSPAISTSYSTNAAGALVIIASQVPQTSSAKNTITTSSNGTFNVTVSIDPGWHIGHHTIRAAEQISSRSAELSFTIDQPGTTPTPTLSPTVTPSLTASVLGLSCVKPASVTLMGRVGYNQPVAQQVSLCTTGSGLLKWKASWDQNAAPWLQLDHSTGQIKAPGQGQVNVSALATGLQAGNYTTTVTFSSQSANSKVSLNVAFTVQAGCVSITPTALKFSGTTGNNSVQTQTVAISNCGSASGNWSASSDANWLKVSPTSGILSAGAIQNVQISVSQGKTGTYSGRIVFTLGSSQFTVPISLTVYALPTLSVSPASINANNDCNHPKRGPWICVVTLSSNKDTQSNLDWFSSSRGLSGIVFNPSSGTLTPGQTVQVQITVPNNDCQNTITLTFSGPVNSVDVPWSCTIIG